MKDRDIASVVIFVILFISWIVWIVYLLTYSGEDIASQRVHNELIEEAIKTGNACYYVEEHEWEFKWKDCYDREDFE